MNICIVTSSFPSNRSEVYHRYIEEVIAVLHAHNHQVTILTQDKDGIKETVIPYVEVNWFPWRMNEDTVLSAMPLKTPKGILSAISLIYNGWKHAAKITSDKKIDVFLCLWTLPSGLYLFLKNLFSSPTPYVVWALGSDIYGYKENFFSRFLLRRIIRNSKAVFADGFDLCEIINKLADRRCEFLPTVHNLRLPESKSVIINTTQKEITFLCVANLTYVKGVDTLIAALKIVNSDFNRQRYRMIIIGDGEMMPELTQEVERDNLGERVSLKGRIMDETLFAEHFFSADCVIIPSRSDSIPVVLSEAIQFGKPVIVTNVGDMEHIVTKYRLGLVAQKDNAADLADKIKQFIDCPVRLNEENRQQVLQTLLFENSSKKLLQALTN